MKRNKVSYINKHTGVFLILASILVISALFSPSFVASNNLLAMLRQASSLGILTIGQLFVIIGGGVDLSVESILQMAITIFMYGYNNFGDAGLIYGLIAAFIFGAFAGLINGILVIRFNVQPFLTTLFTGSIITGIRMIWVGIESAGHVPELIRFFGRDKTLNIPNAVIVLLLVAIIAGVILNKHVYGRKLIAVGTSFTTSVYSGIRSHRTVVFSYIISGVMAVLASIIISGYIGYADRWIGAGMSFNSLIAAVIGGNYLGGGRGSVIGAIGGALLMTIIVNFVILLGLPASYQHIFSGLVLIATIFIGSLSKKISLQNLIGRQ